MVQQLTEKREATIEIKPLPNGLRMRTEPAKNPSELELTLVDSGQVALLVDGKPVRFPAFKLMDDRGSTYTLLNSPTNPLVVSFRFGSDAVVEGKRLLTGAQSGYDVVSFDAPGEQ